MKWSHLPVAGGLYDQHPRLLEEWRIIFQVKAEEDQKRQAEQERKSRAKKG